jgi:glycosyltransferase involved in cell wall biosynthesis
MNICVVATASRESGALTIYQQFLKSLIEEGGNDVYYVFVDSLMPKPAIKNVVYIEFDTHGYRRIIFDFFLFRREINKRGIVPDVIVSFQNTGVKYNAIRQIIYYHNPFISVHRLWNIFDKQQRIPFFYSKLYPIYVKSLFTDDTRVVVQANFMKDCFARKFHFSASNIHVIYPDVLLPEIKKVIPYQFEQGTINFLYPAIPQIYKNHILLVQALNKLRSYNASLVDKIRIHLTFKKEDNKFLYAEILRCGLDAQFVMHGTLKYDILLSMYKSCRALLFPSYIETLGVPLLEAAKFGKPILASDCPYSHETILGYKGVQYISIDDTEKWARAIADICEEAKIYSCYERQNNSSWADLFGLIRNNDKTN